MGGGYKMQWESINYGHFCFCDMRKEGRMGENTEMLKWVGRGELGQVVSVSVTVSPLPVRVFKVQYILHI